MLDKMYYNTVLSQTFSPCGNYLLAGNIYGQIAVFDLDRVLNPLPDLLTADYNRPKYIHALQTENQICSLVSTEKFLIVGSEGDISGFDWKGVLTAKLTKPSWSIKIPSKSSFEQVDVNCLWLSEDGERLYAGCGDNNVYSFSLEDGSLVSTYEGHTDYIHDVHGKGQQIISAGEDGLVKLWDTRTNQPENSFEPHKNSDVARPELGKWVGAASLSDDWIVCGGGPRLALWHRRSLDAVTVCALPDSGVHVARFHEDRVLAAGAAAHLYQLSYAGTLMVELPVSATTVYSVLIRSSPTKVLAIAGSSPDIDLCSTFSYSDQVLQFR